MAEQHQVVDITPSPRILQVLGDIEFENWQCLAELIDNGFDEFLDIKRAELDWAGSFTVSVNVPKADDLDPYIEVRDTGRGMSVDSIREAVRAGFSGNDQFEKLGLFGMGFNIATARMGSVARVLSKRPGEVDWQGVEIDLREISAREEFTAPVIREKADDPSEHGTRVIITGLKPEARDYVSRSKNLGGLRTKLGDVYGALLEEEGFNLYVGGHAVKPRRACVWDESRTVTRIRSGSKEVIPARISIDKELPEMSACARCRHWQGTDLESCEVCGSTELQIRSRRIKGWVGIQRYLSPSDFGIDFIRNGRKILMRDKRVFNWQDPDDAESDVREYPVEVPYEGRIVGEIHIDHVLVNYQKNAFEYGTQAWKTVVRTLRGDGPLQPKRRKEHGYSITNDAPLARLFDGYRRNDPGLNYLMPGNGTAVLKGKAREWAKLFRDGKPEYQSDEKWYEAAKQHDELVEQAKIAGVSGSAGDGEDIDILDQMGLNDDDGSVPPATEEPPAKESEGDRQERLKSGGEEFAELSDEYSLPSVGTTKVSVYLVHGTKVTNESGVEVPVYFSAIKGNSWYAFIDKNAPLFVDFGSSYADAFLAELAYSMKTRADSPVPLTTLISELKVRHLPDLRLDPQTLSAAARDLLATIGDRMANGSEERAADIWAGLSPTERTAIETRASVAGSSLGSDPGSDPEFLRNLPPMLTPRIIDRFPALLLDGEVVSDNYAGLSEDNVEAREILRGRIVSYLTDLALVADAPTALGAIQLRRIQYTIELMRERVDGAAGVSAA
jgi:hypothetical protein